MQLHDHVQPSDYIVIDLDVGGNIEENEDGFAGLRCSSITACTENM